MGDFVLNAKHWQLFLLLSSTHVAPWFIRDAFVVELLVLLNALLYFSWLALLGNSLYRASGGFAHSLSWFLLDILILLVAVGFSAIIESDDFHVTTNSFEAHNTGSLPLVCVFFAALHTHWFPASLLLSAEQQQTPDFSNYLGTVVLIFSWPVGIWFIQPRLNQIQELSSAHDAHPFS
ncbi:hypothetical protein [Hymenobacter elongatus]|uniref:Uncharacterized protein n=1 Tax=Hymenobacter elongatus TaxID=877208 RepID=A0A4Z0PIR7_9BACT|nr:hypothetical protein [Hymenobacter elongatus]TGE14815.1 hypothetical protein E5J99_14385 [Hymenobacter elongatus]